MEEKMWDTVSLESLAVKYYRPDDPVRKPHYIKAYDHHFTSLRNQKIRVLELGCFEGTSLLMWSEYFPHADFVTIDLGSKPPTIEGNERIKFIHGFQDDPQIMKRACDFTNGELFDIVIDDCSHIGTTSLNSFEYLFRQGLKPGGLYVVEDIAAPFGVPNWPDGAPYNPEQHGIIDGNRIITYDFGMMGFMKLLYDHLNVATISNRLPIRSIASYQHISFLTKEG